MEPHAVVVAVDEDREVLSQMFQIAVFVGVNFFSFKSLHEALTTRIVIRISRPAHAGNHAMLSQHGDIGAGSVLHTAIGMVHHARRWLPFCDRLLQRRKWQPRGQRAIQFPANHLPRKRIQDHVIGVKYFSMLGTTIIPAWTRFWGMLSYHPIAVVAL